MFVAISLGSVAAAAAVLSILIHVRTRSAKRAAASSELELRDTAPWTIPEAQMTRKNT